MMEPCTSDMLYTEDLDLIAKDSSIQNRLQGKTFAITGASGMIGSFLTDALLRMNDFLDTKITIIAISRNSTKLLSRFKRHNGDPNLILLEQDVCNCFHTENNIPDFVIHAASNTHPLEYASDPIGTITTNVFGTYNILEWASSHSNTRVLLLSSVEIYGENRGDVNEFDETYMGFIDCNTLRAGYPESKRLSETLLQAYIKQKAVDGVIIRLSRIYGSNLESDDSKALSQFLKKGIAGEDIVLKSKGDQFFSYLYLADAASAILYTLLYGKSGEAYNAASRNSNISLKDLATIIAKTSGVQLKYELPDQLEKSGYSTATKAILNPDKLIHLGWKERYSIESGIKRTMKILS